MNAGMLWFDNSNTTLAQKIQKAAAYYEKKYGRKPELCLVTSGMTLPDTGVGEGMPITVRSSKFVLPGHLWLGIEEMPEQVNGE
jgi:hypothetical protein